MPGVGLVPFLQTFVCNLDNHCFTKEEKLNPSELNTKNLASISQELGTIFASNETLNFLKILNNNNSAISFVQNILSKKKSLAQLDTMSYIKYYIRDISKLKDMFVNEYKILNPEDADNLFMSKLNFAQFLNTSSNLTRIICDQNQLKTYIAFPLDSNINRISASLCTLNITGLSRLSYRILPLINISSIVRVMQYVEEVKESFVSTTHLSLTFDEIAQMTDVLMKSENIFLIIFKLTTEPNILGEIQTIPVLINIFSKLPDVLPGLKNLMSSLNPVLSTIGFDTSTLWSLLDELSKLEDNINKLKEGSWNQSSQIFLEPVLAIFPKYKNLSMNDSGPITITLLELASNLFGGIGNNGSLPSLEIINSTKMLQQMLEALPIWPSIQNGANVVNQWLELIYPVVKILYDLNLSLQSFYKTSENLMKDLTQITEKYPTLIQSFVGLLFDPSVSLTSIFNGGNISAVCHAVFSKLAVNLGSPELNTLSGVLCAQSLTEALQGVIDTSQLTDLMKKLNETGLTTNSTLNDRPANLTNIYIQFYKILYMLQGVLNISTNSTQTSGNSNQGNLNIISTLLGSDLLPSGTFTSLKLLLSILQLPNAADIFTDPDFAIVLDYALDVISSRNKGVLSISNLMKANVNLTDYLTKVSGLPSTIVNYFVNAKVINNGTYIFQQSVPVIVKTLCDPVSLTSILKLPDSSPFTIANISTALCNSQVVSTAEFLKIYSLNTSMINDLLFNSALNGLTDLASTGMQFFTKYSDVITLVTSFLKNSSISILRNNSYILDDLLVNNTLTDMSESLQIFKNILVNISPTDSNIKMVTEDLQKAINGLRGLDTVKAYLLKEIQIKNAVKVSDNVTNYLIKNFGFTAETTQNILNALFSSYWLLGYVDTSNHSCVELMKGLIFVNATQVLKGKIEKDVCALNSTSLEKLYSTLAIQMDVFTLLNSYLTNTGLAILSSSNMTTEELSDQFAQLEKGLKNFFSARDILVESLNKNDIIKSFADAAASGSIDSNNLTQSICGRKSEDIFSFPPTPGVSFASKETLLKKFQQETSQVLANELPGQFCMDLYKKIKASELGVIIWSFVKPILRGKILYTPDNELTRAIIAKANQTFAIIDDVFKTAEAWSNESSDLNSLIKLANDTKDVLGLDFVQGILKATTGVQFNSLLSGLVEDGSKSFSDEVIKYTNIIQAATEVIYNYTSCIQTNRFQPVSNEEELKDMAYQLSKTNMFLAGIVFVNLDAPKSSTNRSRREMNGAKLPKHIKYKLRMDVDNVMETIRLKLAIDYSDAQSNFIESLRYLRGFVYLQSMIDKAIIDLQSSDDVSVPGMYLKQLPFPCHHTDSLVYIIGSFCVPIMMIVVFVAILAIATSILVYDKEDGQEEILHVMGMMKGLNSIAWFFSSMVIMSIDSLVIAIMLKWTNIFFYSDLSIIFLFILAFCFSSCLLVYMVSAFFTRTSMAILFVLIVFFLTFLPYTLVIGLEIEMKFQHRLLASLASTTAFCFGSLRLTNYEVGGFGVDWSNINETVNEQVSVSWSFYMMIIDGAIYFVIGWYVRHVIPGKYGVAYPFYFPFQLSYWKSCFKYRHPVGDLTSLHPNTSGTMFEPPPDSARVGIAVENVSKIFGKKKKALEKLSVSFYKDQITTLLGPNGAAKTTTIKIICGLLHPSSGQVRIYGEEHGSMYNLLGICPQHNALFSYMTVLNHMRFYFVVKSCHKRVKASDEITRLLKDVDLWHARNVPVQDLSYGMKRRLCVALAFVGGSKTIILDEPTSGVDPYARKQIWNLVTKNRSDRTILLTTHHLDEADFLSDRVAVMHAGKLICYGSPSFIKWSVGGSYRLTVIIKDHFNVTQYRDNQETAVTRSKNVTASVSAFILSLCPKATLTEQVGSDLTFHLPKDPAAMSVPFDAFFRKLDLSLEHLNIATYGLSDTSLEEVFLKLTKSADSETELSHRGSNGGLENCDNISNVSPESDIPELLYDISERRTGTSLLLAQITALLLKRLHHYRRNWRILVSAILLPILFFGISLVFATVRLESQEPKELLLDPSIYGPNLYSFFQDSAKNNLSNKYVNGLVNSNIGYGTVCMNEQRNPVCVANSTWYNHSQIIYLPQCVDAYQILRELPFYYNLSEKLVQAGDYIQNVKDLRLPFYLMMSFQKYFSKRYGGWSFEPSVNNKSVDSYAWFSTRGYHAMPAFLNSLSNAILRSHLPDGENPDEYGITTTTAPLRLSRQALTTKEVQGDAADAGLGIVLVITFSFIPCSFILYIINEKVMKERQLQNISGIGIFIYWTVALIWDMLTYSFTLTLAVILVVIFQVEAFYLKDNLAGFVSIVLLYGWANIPCLYCLSRFFTKGSTAYLVSICVNIFLVMGTIISMIIMLLYRDSNTARVAYDLCLYIFLIFPQFCLGQGLIDMSSNTYIYKLVLRYNDVQYESPFLANILGWKMVSLAAQGFLYFTLNLILDALKSPRLSLPPEVNVNHEQEDDDVIREKQRILTGSAHDLLIVSGLSKVYRRNWKHFLAVNHISFGVPEGECFGLLGVNGAGKTTTFRMLTGDLTPESGTIILKGKSLTGNNRNFGQYVGYCPQEGGLDEYLTGEEMLYFHSRLRGFNSEQTVILVSELLDELGLIQYARSPVHTYSGGTRRKLSLAIALLGNPPILFLDEPTTGMDAATRRLAWNCIARAKRNGQSVILTSHSMDECDALCSTIAIMVNGKMKCIGSPQHLKYKFGDGYTVIMHNGNGNLGDIIDEFVTKFPGSVIKANHHSSVELHVPKDSCVVADILASLQAAQNNKIIGYYSLTQTTLDSVFISFAQDQSESIQEQLIARASSTEGLSDSLVDTMSTTSSIQHSQSSLKHIPMGSSAVENVYVKDTIGANSANEKPPIKDDDINLVLAPALSYSKRNYVQNIQLSSAGDQISSLT